MKAQLAEQPKPYTTAPPNETKRREPNQHAGVRAGEGAASGAEPLCRGAGRSPRLGKPKIARNLARAGGGAQEDARAAAGLAAGRPREGARAAAPAAPGGCDGFV